MNYNVWPNKAQEFNQDEISVAVPLVGRVARLRKKPLNKLN